MNHTSFAAEPYLPYQGVIAFNEKVSSYCLDDRKDRPHDQGSVEVITL